MDYFLLLLDVTVYIIHCIPSTGVYRDKNGSMNRFTPACPDPALLTVCLFLSRIQSHPVLFSQAASAQMAHISEEESEKMNLAKLAGSQKVRGKELEDMDIVDVNADSALGGTEGIQVKCVAVYAC